MEQKIDKDKIKDIIVNNRFLLIFALLILSAIILVLVINNSGDNKVFILLDANHVIQVSKDDFKLIDRNDSDSLEYLNQKYRVFYSGTFLGSYGLDNETKLTQDDDTLYFTDDKKSFSFEKPNLAVSRNVDYIDYDFLEMDEDDFITMRDGLGISWVDNLSDLIYAKKVELDFNADGKEEVLYFVTCIGESNEQNLSADGTYSKPPFSIVYISIDDEIMLLEESTVNNNEQILDEYELSYIIDVFKDGNYEIVMSYTSYDISNYKVYQINGKNCDLILDIE